MNLMQDICDKLGVEVNEEFYITGVHNTWFRLNDNGIEFRTYNTRYSGANPEFLQDLITGRIAIEKLPFLPQSGQKYWTIGFTNGNMSELKILDDVWKGTSIDYMRKSYGIVYRNEKEATIDRFNGFTRVMTT